MALQRQVCDVSLYFDPQKLVDVIRGDKPENDLEEMTNVIMNESIGLSNELDRILQK